MNIAELQTARKALEDEIHKTISEALERFKNATGLCPDNINIQLVNVTTISSPSRQFVVGKVTVDIQL